MRVPLSPSFELSTEHAASRYGQPVLVHRTSGEAYGPADLLRAYPSYGYLPAAHVVARLAGARAPNAKAMELVALFVATFLAR